jgi:hypothetical protein
MRSSSEIYKHTCENMQAIKLIQCTILSENVCKVYISVHVMCIQCI